MTSTSKASWVIEPISDRYVEPAARLLAESMAEPMTHVFGDSGSPSMHAFRMSQFQRAKLAQELNTHPPTRVLVAREADASASASSARQGLLGFAVWEVINEAPVEGSDKADDVLPEMAPFSETTNVALFKQLWVECEKAMDKHTKGRPTCHVKYLIIASEAQRRGVGRALMAQVKEDARSVPASQSNRLIFLDAAPTEMAVPFYLGQGFKLVDECSAPGVEESPTLYEMLWEGDE